MSSFRPTILITAVNVMGAMFSPFSIAPVSGAEPENAIRNLAAHPSVESAEKGIPTEGTSTFSKEDSKESLPADFGMPVELKPLAHMLGDWNIVQTSAAGGKSTRSLSARWILKKTAIQKLCRTTLTPDPG
ncbi:MAG: hypothetical protein O3A00_12780 [Planctomycetota bacterium]|nr:hypothetical protein [Planctomycetota bacterium]